jgi:hypothetical protein
MTRAALLENSPVVFKDAHPHPRVVSPSDRAGFSKTFDSDDHFDRPFSFMAVKGNYEAKKRSRPHT